MFSFPIIFKITLSLLVETKLVLVLEERIYCLVHIFINLRTIKTIISVESCTSSAKAAQIIMMHTDSLSSKHLLCHQLLHCNTANTDLFSILESFTFCIKSYVAILWLAAFQNLFLSG